jgi:hypothetical protein
VEIAALYVDPRGPYPKIPGVDCWDESRDARNYARPGPVIAHPPCGPWGSLSHVCHGRAKDCGPIAVEQVRRHGGVLEHPARSKLFMQTAPGHAIHGWGDLPLPGQTDGIGGYTIEVCQVEWGHVARKRTWLYLVGVPHDAIEAPPYPGRVPTHWVSGRHKPYAGADRMRAAGKRPPGLCPPEIKICSAAQRRRTPPEFAAYLVRLARSVRR